MLTSLIVWSCSGFTVSQEWRNPGSGDKKHLTAEVILADGFTKQGVATL